MVCIVDVEANGSCLWLVLRVLRRMCRVCFGSADCGHGGVEQCAKAGWTKGNFELGARTLLLALLLGARTHE